MTITPHSVAVIAPQARWGDMRALWQAFGYELGDGVPMSATGSDPATHRGAHMWLTAQEALDFTGRPDIVIPPGYNLGQVVSVLQQFRIRVANVDTDHGGPAPASKPAGCSVDYLNGEQTLTKRTHFDQVASDRSIQPIGI